MVRSSLGSSRGATSGTVSWLGLMGGGGGASWCWILGAGAAGAAGAGGGGGGGGGGASACSVRSTPMVLMTFLPASVCVASR